MLHRRNTEKQLRRELTLIKLRHEYRKARAKCLVLKMLLHNGRPVHGQMQSRLDILHQLLLLLLLLLEVVQTVVVVLWLKTVAKAVPSILKCSRLAPPPKPGR
ncbi:hypothetical protein niasHT_012800 [Heterodera trifolii]|uniref:Uncharacterized protein n=1 Tax=Heterodera trifolii TaxID=157864 RepID=A0ABD2L934_9BILA